MKLAFLNWLFPPLCVGCQKPGTRLCASCSSHLTRLDPDWDLIERLHLPPELGHVWSAVEYRDLATTLVKQVKYQHYYDYCQLMAQLMNEQFGALLQPEAFDALIPIPLAPSRQRWRGYNQAEKLSRSLCHFTHIPVNSRLLIRPHYRINQAMLNRQERQQLGHDFVLTTNHLPGQKFCLIDDVITTGATLQAGANLFRQAGAEVQVATFALTVSGNI